MKKSLLILLSFLAIIVNAQMPKHIKWQISTKTLSEKEAEVTFKAVLDPHWHIWSVNPGDEMLIPPTFTIQGNGVKTIGKAREIGKKITKKEEGYDGDLHFFEGTVSFIQKVSYTKPSDIKVSVEYQICDEHSCLPPNSEEFSSKIAAFGEMVKEDTTAQTAANIDSAFQATSDTAAASIPVEEEISEYGIFGKTLADCSQKEDVLNVWTAFLAGIAGGFLALFFPCTFPMIPMTMSFFLKGSAENKKKGTRNAILYGFAIFLVYFLFSLPFTFLGLSSDFLNDFSTNIYVNLTFFVIFIFFAFSLFGYYDISMPSSIATKMDSKSDAGSFIGIFFMALTLAIVSFSCTGPILGLVLGNLKNVNLILPAFSGFGLGLGIPFALFALFPNLLKSLPKSGSWLDVVKVVFGFIELAFAFKFLSNADLVKQWGFLKRELFVAIWIVISVLCAMYLMGWFSFKKGATIKKTITTYILSGVFFLFSAYLVTDFFGGELQLISGFPPPKSYSFSKQPEKFNTHINDYEGALALAQKENKPLMIDFTGWACVNCRKMEEQVWITPEVYDILSKKYVIVSLYVDEKRELPKEEQYFSKSLNKQVITVGNKWTDFELTNFKQVTQPLYVIIHPHKKQIINKPIGGFMDQKTYLEFLKCGLEGMK
jgi:thiol:disulfide interchange protein DsbD